jgi:hypothetical protein
MAENTKLLDLPSAVFALIFQHLGAAASNAFFRASRSCRDLVLAETRAVRVKLRKEEAPPALDGPLGRFVDRAFSSGACKLFVDSGGLGKDCSGQILTDLLHLGSTKSGWPAVQVFSLTVGKALGLPAARQLHFAIWHVMRPNPGTHGLCIP